MQYAIHRKTLNQMTSSGLTSILSDSRFSDIYRPGHYLDEGDVSHMVQEMQRTGHLIIMHSIERQKLIRDAYSLIDGTSLAWQVETDDGNIELGMESNQVPLILGYLGSQLIPAVKVAQFEQFGFSSVRQLLVTAGAHLDTDYLSYKFSYDWSSERGPQDARFSVFGSEHGDFRIRCVDATARKVVDPLGGEMPFTPHRQPFVSYVSGYHSGEPELFVSLLRYTEQVGVESVYTDKDEALKLIADHAERPYAVGNFADAGAGSAFGVRSSFVCYDTPFRRVQPDGSLGPGISYISVEGQRGHYQMAMDANDHLAFYYVGPDRDVTHKMTMSPDDAVELMHGLLANTYKGTLRTVPSQLIDALEYRHSDAFAQSEFRKRADVPSSS